MLKIGRRGGVNLEMENGGGSMRRAEIDTRAPFRSVKEAVIIFGEKVLAGEVYANKLNQMRTSGTMDEHRATRLDFAVAELEETKQNLEKAREESQIMANFLNSLKEELELTKMELIQLKATQSDKQVVESQMEDLKFVENAPEIEIKIESSSSVLDQEAEFQKKRSVKFANPPSLTQIMNTEEEQVLERRCSVETQTKQSKKKKKKKRLMPLIEAIFFKKKGVSYA